MPTKLYIDKKTQLLNDIVQTNKYDTAHLQSFSFNMTSASLANFLPGLNFHHHLKLYKQILFHQQLSLLDQEHPELLDNITLQNFEQGVIEQWRNQPAIFITFHTGSYRMINHFLLANRIPFSLILAPEVVKQQQNNFQTLYKSYHQHGESSHLTCIDAESPGAALKMIREIKNGNSLVIYIDGNTGSGNKEISNSNHILFNFLNGRLLLRIGASMISHICGCPMHCIASTRGGTDQIFLNFLGTVRPFLDESKARYAERSIKVFYNQLSSIVQRYPAQWEAWLYIHKFAQLSTLHSALPINQQNQCSSIGKFLQFNSDEFGTFILDEQYYLLHKGSYTFYQIDQHLFECLSQAIMDCSALPGFENLFLELVGSCVLKPTC